MTRIVNGYKIESCADLKRANLSGVDLCGQTLFRANLIGASLIGTNLTRVPLSEAYLIGVDLRSATLHGASVKETDFSGADISRAYFRGARFGPDGPDPMDFVGCIGLESAIFDKGVKEAIMAGLDDLKKSGGYTSMLSRVINIMRSNYCNRYEIARREDELKSLND